MTRLKPDFFQQWRNIMDGLDIILLGRMGGFKMFNATTLKAAIGVALGMFAYTAFIKPNVPFL